MITTCVGLVKGFPGACDYVPEVNSSWVELNKRRVESLIVDVWGQPVIT